MSERESLEHRQRLSLKRRPEEGCITPLRGKKTHPSGDDTVHSTVAVVMDSEKDVNDSPDLHIFDDDGSSDRSVESIRIAAEYATTEPTSGRSSAHATASSSSVSEDSSANHILNSGSHSLSLDFPPTAKSDSVDRLRSEPSIEHPPPSMTVRLSREGTSEASPAIRRSVPLSRSTKTSRRSRRSGRSSSKRRGRRTGRKGEKCREPIYCFSLRNDRDNEEYRDNRHFHRKKIALTSSKMTKAECLNHLTTRRRCSYAFYCAYFLNLHQLCESPRTVLSAIVEVCDQSIRALKRREGRERVTREGLSVTLPTPHHKCIPYSEVMTPMSTISTTMIDDECQTTTSFGFPRMSTVTVPATIQDRGSLDLCDSHSSAVVAYELEDEFGHGPSTSVSVTRVSPEQRRRSDRLRVSHSTDSTPSVSLTPSMTPSMMAITPRASPSPSLQPSSVSSNGSGTTSSSTLTGTVTPLWSAIHPAVSATPTGLTSISADAAASRVQVSPAPGSADGAASQSTSKLTLLTLPPSKTSICQDSLSPSSSVATPITVRDTCSSVPSSSMLAVPKKSRSCSSMTKDATHFPKTRSCPSLKSADKDASSSSSHSRPSMMESAAQREAFDHYRNIKHCLDLVFHWIHHYPSDFADKELKQILIDDFLQDLGSRCKGYGSCEARFDKVKRLIRAKESKMTRPSLLDVSVSAMRLKGRTRSIKDSKSRLKATAFQFTDSFFPPPEMVAHLGGKPRLLELSPVMVAEQLTLIDTEIFLHISLRELTNLSWMKKPKISIDMIPCPIDLISGIKDDYYYDRRRKSSHHSHSRSHHSADSSSALKPPKKQEKEDLPILEAPNLIYLIDHVNREAQWVATEIVCRRSTSRQCEMCQWFYAVAQRCLELSNIHSATSIFMGISMFCVQRLRHIKRMVYGRVSTAVPAPSLLSRSLPMPSHHHHSSQSRSMMMPSSSVMSTIMNNDDPSLLDPSGASTAVESGGESSISKVAWIELIHKELDSLINSDRNYANYRAIQEEWFESDELFPCLPFIPVIVKDLFAVQSMLLSRPVSYPSGSSASASASSSTMSHPSISKEKMIDLNLLDKNCRLMRRMRELQQRSEMYEVCLTENLDIKNAIRMSISSFKSKESLMKLSMTLQPKQTKDEVRNDDMIDQLEDFGFL